MAQFGSGPRLNSPLVADLALAVDIGGTKMAAGLVARDGTLRGTGDAADPASGPEDAEALWATWRSLVRGRHVPVGTGGPPRSSAAPGAGVR